MAKKFAGFKPETLKNKILPALGYDGPTDSKSINEFLAANPAAAAKMGKYTLAARRTIEGSAVKMYAGGMTPDQQAQADSKGFMPVDNAPKAQPTLDFGQDQNQRYKIVKANEGLLAGNSSADEMTKNITEDPTSMVVRPDVVANVGDKALTTIASTVGQADSIANQANITEAKNAADAQVVGQTTATTMEAQKAAADVNKALNQAQVAQGQVSQAAQAEAAQGDPSQLAQLNLQAAQGQATQIDKADVPVRQLEQGETISGSAVDMGAVEQTFGTGEVEAATVSGEMDRLMEDFEGGDTPAWAAGAMRAAQQQMAARGLSASSMAGMAVVQAAMESAIPIAQMDAANKQQMALLKAEQRANFMGQDFDQAFQTKVLNAARISEIADQNFTAEQQVMLENARMANTMNLENLSNRQAKIMADAATMAQMDLANLDNRQATAVRNANAFLEMDMQNLSNEQAVTVFKNQERVAAILSDVAAENASRQFNATSKQQNDQFFASLGTQISQFNTDQKNAMARFNAGESNALAQFNTSQQNARDQFNASNHLIVEQANAQWFQSVTTAANAAANQANRDEAMAANNLTSTAYNNIVQRERDILAWAWTSAENAAERDAKVMIAKIGATDGESSSGGNMLSDVAAKLLGDLAAEAAKKIFDIF